MSTPFIIAEAGVNHNGSLERALELVDIAADAGADAVKFQTFFAEQLVSASSRKARYQVENMGTDESQLAMLKTLELPHEAHEALAARCADRGIEFMSTAFDLDSLQFLLDLGIKRVKIPSGDVTAHPLLLAAGRAGVPIILSTGMCTLAEIEDALGVLAFALIGRDETPSPEHFVGAFASDSGQAALRSRVTILHCVTDYPAAPEVVNLRAMETIHDAFGLLVGYSDHSMGIAISIAAAALGATVIEKHFTVDRSLPGPDHKASLEPNELGEMVRGVRDVALALGDGRKRPTSNEIENRAVIRRSLVAIAPIRAGEPFSVTNIAPMRPATGIVPARYWEALERVAGRDFAPGDFIEL